MAVVFLIIVIMMFVIVIMGLLQVLDPYMGPGEAHLTEGQWVDDLLYGLPG